jgi:hypothetical protein
MSSEKFQVPIEAESVQDHERELRLRIIQIQLAFLEQQLKDDSNKEKKYIDLFQEITKLLGKLSWIRLNFEIKDINSLAKSDRDSMDKKYRGEIREDIKKIGEETSGNDRINAVYNYVKSAIEKYPEPEEKEENKAGLIRFHSGKVWEKVKIEDLSGGDDLIHIHLNPAFTENKDVKPNDIKEWLSQIAKAIVEKYPETRAVMGTSWLFSHPIMKRLGFKILPPDNDASRYGSIFWDQLTDKNGQIDLNRLNFFQTHGKMPFEAASGYILVEDFLKKYLPNDMAQEITLKKLNPEIQKRNSDIRRQMQEDLKNNWQIAIDEQKPADFLMEKIPGFVEVAKSLGLEGEIRSFFEECIRKRIPGVDVDSNNDLMLKYRDTIEKIKAKIEEGSYEEYKISL